MDVDSEPSLNTITLSSIRFNILIEIDTTHKKKTIIYIHSHNKPHNSILVINHANFGSRYSIITVGFHVRLQPSNRLAIFIGKALV